MMTLDDIRNVEFNRGRGYRADEVDDFIDNCVDTMEALVRENEELNRKMKVLADKVNEYRADEDAIRSALLNAQRAGDTVLRDANAKAEQILKEAQEKAQSIREDAKGAIAAENEELARMQREVTAFKERLMKLYKEHVALLNLLPVQEAAPAPAPVEEPTAEEPIAPVEEDEAETHLIESNNFSQRHWFARFRRKTCCVSRSLKMIDLTMFLFAAVHVNKSIDVII